MSNKPVKAAFIDDIIRAVDSYPTTLFLKNLPRLIGSYFPLAEIIFYYKDARGDSLVPYANHLDSDQLPVLNEKNKIVSAFTKNLSPFWLGEEEQIYVDVFNRETENLISRHQLNVVFPLSFKKRFRGLILAHMDKMAKKRMDEIADILLAAATVFIPYIELERMELKNDRNYYKLFKFDRLVLLGEMLASFAHECRTPLHAIQIELKELKDQFVPNEDADASLTQLQHQTSRLSRLIQSLLSFSKVRDISEESFNLKNYMEMLLDEIPKKRKPPGVIIDVNIDPAFYIYSDKNRLRQVLTNILFNAFDALNKEGLIVIDAYRESGKRRKEEVYVLTIKNNGPAIPQHIKERIFEPFFTTRETGTGLGLYIAYGIMESLKGELDVESSDKGTTFFITLPGGSECQGGQSEKKM